MHGGLVDEPVSGPAQESHLWADLAKLDCSKTAFLEFLSAAAGTSVISHDAFERILLGLAARTISFSLVPPPLLIFAVLLTEAVPSRQARRWCHRKGCIHDHQDARTRRGAQCPV